MEQIILGNKTSKSMPMSSISFEKFYFSSKKKTMKNGLSQSDMTATVEITQQKKNYQQWIEVGSMTLKLDPWPN